MEFIRFLQPDPDYKVVPSEVVVSVGQITKIEPRYFETSGGKRFLTQVTKYGEEELMKGIERLYIIYDSLGNKYSSATASEEGRALIERIWMSAK